MKRKFLYAVAMFAMIGLTTACDSNKNDLPDGPDSPDSPKGEVALMTPTECKQYLEETATEVLNKFRAADQKDVITLASYVTEEYEDLEAPKEFGLEYNEVGNVPVNYVRSMIMSMTRADAAGAGEAAISYVTTLDFSKFTGVYEPGASRWVRKSDSNDIIFRFKDQNDATCELKAELSKDYNTGEITNIYDDYYYDDNYNWVEYTAADVFKYRLPKNVTITLTQGGEQLSVSKVTTNLDVKGHVLNITANVQLANLTASVNLDANDSQAKQTSSFTVSGETLLSSTATLNGSHLCDIDYFMNNEVDEDDMLIIFQNGTAAVSVLNRVRMDGDLTYNRDIYKAIDSSFGSWNYDTQAEAEDAVRRTVDQLNKYITAKVSFKNAVTQQASLIWKYNFDKSEYGSWWEFNIEPLIKFDADGTTYSFEEYFENGFANLADQFESLQKSYEKVWESVRR